MEPDFPAAHSMDTTWYAVDEHGHVAAFDTGEDGALPTNAATGMGPSDPNFDDNLLELLGLVAMLQRGEDPLADREPWIAAGRTLVLVDPPAGDPTLPGWVNEAIEHDEFEQAHAGPPLLLLSRAKFGEDRVRALSQREGVRWTMPLKDLRDFFASWDPPEGFFSFGRDHGDDPGRYECSAAPEKPLHIDQLVSELAEAMSRLRLPVDFRSGDPVHLADHDVHAETWGDLPLRYTEQWHQQQRVLFERRAAQRQSGRGRAILLVIIVLAVLVWWLTR